MKFALIVIDLQEPFMLETGVAPLVQASMPYVNGTVELFHKHNLPIVYVKDVEGGSSEFIDQLSIADGSIEIEKNQCNSFFNTDLESQLKNLDVTFNVLCGFSAAFCVTASYFGSNERGFTTALLKGGISAASQTSIDHAYAAYDTISYSSLEALLS